MSKRWKAETPRCLVDFTADELVEACKEGTFDPEAVLRKEKQSYGRKSVIEPLERMVEST